ncbi:MAG: hypothetical protein LBG52_07480 [Candidatus Peribacteria bacterium]|jgi:hypothetical protein|nr:hypothetical protein [Candidatus Peribacteria bacterium]
MDTKKLTHEELLNLYDEYEEKYREMLDGIIPFCKSLYTIRVNLGKEIQVRQGTL